MFNRTSEECVFLEIQKGKLFSLQTLLPEITTRTLPPSDRSTTNVPLCQHFSACAHSQAKDVLGLELTLNQRPKLEGRNFGNTRKLPSMIFIKITRSVTIESTEHTSSEAKEMLNEY